jgi:hypothetical protein
MKVRPAQRQDPTLQAVAGTKGQGCFDPSRINSDLSSALLLRDLPPPALDRPAPFVAKKLKIAFA